MSRSDRVFVGGRGWPLQTLLLIGLQSSLVFQNTPSLFDPQLICPLIGQKSHKVPVLSLKAVFLTVFPLITDPYVTSKRLRPGVHFLEDLPGDRISLRRDPGALFNQRGTLSSVIQKEHLPARKPGGVKVKLSGRHGSLDPCAHCGVAGFSHDVDERRVRPVRAAQARREPGWREACRRPSRTRLLNQRLCWHPFQRRRRRRVLQRRRTDRS